MNKETQSSPASPEVIAKFTAGTPIRCHQGQGAFRCTVQTDLRIGEEFAITTEDGQAQTLGPITGITQHTTNTVSIESNDTAWSIEINAEPQTASMRDRFTQILQALFSR